jgi:hypothetical protein
VARGTEFSGYDPASIALSGVLALFVATIQSYWVRNSLYDFSMCVVIWVAIPAVSVTSVSRRSRATRYSGFAKEMIHPTVEQFLPTISLPAEL